ncbi:MAG: exodeoxyribonuclease VII small subunit [Sporomusaceae bacterium]|nr:exodeoxyribonuclease VII small subunit [Sporomusaceae bacterium]
MARTPKTKELSFEEALEQLEIIVKELEEGELTLENSLTKFAAGVSLSKKCLGQLNLAQEKIDKILQEENGELILKVFEFQEGGAE